MPLLSEMHKLTLNLLGAYDDRTAAAASLRCDTRQQLADFRTAHQAMSTAQQQHLAEQMDARHTRVISLRQAARAFLKDLDTSHQAMAHAQGQQLAGGRARLGADTAAFRKELDDAHQTMNHEQQQRLDIYLEDLDRQVTSLRHAANAFLKDLDASHQAMADRQRESMAAARQRLASDVASARRGFQAEQDAMRADQRGARLVWQALAGLKQQRRTMRPVVIAHPIGEPTIAKAPPAPEPAQPAREAAVAKSPLAPGPGSAVDDLKTIGGIGASMERRLHQAGIRTFAQLAASTPEALREALGAASRLAKVEAGITPARELTE